MSDTRIFRATETSDSKKAARRQLIPDPPPWRVFSGKSAENRGRDFLADEATIEVVNAALCLRRPILIEGGPGMGKTTLAYAVARELGLPRPCRWSITSRSTLKDGLYLYDAVGRLQWANQMNLDNQTGETLIGDFLRLGPLGMGMLQSKPKHPAVVLIDEIDKSDQDLPNDLLHVFEEGSFDIPEIQRMRSSEDVEVMPWGIGAKVKVPSSGQIVCQEFPLIVMTSNGERAFPGPFLRRCLRINLRLPADNEANLKEHLKNIISAHFKGHTEEGNLKAKGEARDRIIDLFSKLVINGKTVQAVDQLLNAMHLLLRGDDVSSRDELRKRIFADLSTS